MPEIAVIAGALAPWQITAMNELATSTFASRAAPAAGTGEAGPAALAAPALPDAALDSAIALAMQALLALQQADGHWVVGR